MSSEIELKRLALKIRAAVMTAIACKGGGHVGGSLDLAELLAVLYQDFMRVDPANPNWENRDYFICSKGHAGPVLYSTLALKGFFPYEKLKTLNQENSMLPGHCDRMKVPGVDATSGSLGQGLSIASGLALASQIKNTDQKVFCVIGDGESAEGQIWEAAQFAAHYHLQQLIAFLDWNKKQIDGTNEEVMSLGNIEEKFRSFGWDSCTVDGGNVIEIQQAIQQAVNEKNGKPTMIILNTVKGNGVKCVSDLANNHCIGINAQMYETAKVELDRQAKELGVEIEWLK